MALAKKCDRCGKLYEHYPDDNNYYHYNAVRRIKYTSDGCVISQETGKDLCPECMKKFDEFMRGEI